MAYRKPTYDLQRKENCIMAANRLPKSNAVNIKDKISLWEGKDLSSSASSTFTIVRSSLTKDNSIETDSASNEILLNGKPIAKENAGTDIMPAVPINLDLKTKLNQSKNESDKLKTESGGTAESRDNQAEKENFKAGNLMSSSPVTMEKSLFGSRKIKDKESSCQDRKAVFSLFKKLEVMEDRQHKTPTELGNYFSPPTKTKQQGDTKKKQHSFLETGYSAPASPPINPVPKPRRTFQHPPHSGTLPRSSRGQRHLPPLPSKGASISSKPPAGVYRSRNNRKSLELEDTLGSTRSLFSRSLSQEHQEHHYEDVLDKENPYEDIELESTCSQQSLPSSPGADTNKVSRPGFFRQSSARSFKMLDLCKAQQSVSVSTKGVSSPPRLSPPSTPRTPDRNSWCNTDVPYTRTCHRIPAVVLRINSIFEARIGKKYLRRIYHYAETSSGRVTDDSTSESEIEERTKAHRQRLAPVKAVLTRSNQNKYRTNDNNRSSSVEHQRRLLEYFVVVSLQKSKSSGQYQPEVTQQFPPKLEQSFKLIKATEEQLKSIPLFCFPDAKDWEPVDNYQSEMFSFVLTGMDGSRRFGYCRRLLPCGKGKRLPEVYCIISHLGCFNLFSKVRDASHSLILCVVLKI